MEIKLKDYVLMYVQLETINIWRYAYFHAQNLMFKVVIYVLLDVKRMNTEMGIYVMNAQ